jgi:hypothetical protein
MNYYVIILIVVIIVLLFILYRYFNNSGKRLIAKADLNKTNHQAIKVNDTSTRFAYGVWIYVNSWDVTSIKQIFYRENNIKLYLAKDSPTLYVDLTQNVATTTPASSATPPIEISTNFPVQKWCYVCVNVDGRYVDCYVDGKLVKSVLLQNTILTPVSSKDVYIGDTDAHNILLADFHHWTNSITPQDVWSKYVSGNGGSYFSNLFASYGLGFSVLKDNVEQTNLRVF